MRRTFLLLLIAISSKLLMAQVDYYDITTHENVNVNKNVNVSGYVHQSQTITTFDYGALALANAEQEKNRLAAQQYADERSRMQALEIAANPLKAYDYGYIVNQEIKRKNSKQFLENQGFKKVTQKWVVPTAFFYTLSFNEIQNISEEGITTYISLGFPTYTRDEHIEKANNFYEKFLSSDSNVGDYEIFPNGDTIWFVDKTTKQLSTVWGIQGSRITTKWESEGQICITDNYIAKTNYPGNGLLYFCKVRYYGDKSEINWEKLEGRRYYLKKLVDKLISAARIYDYEIVKEK